MNNKELELINKLYDLYSGFLDGIDVCLLPEDYKVLDKIENIIIELKKNEV